MEFVLTSGLKPEKKRWDNREFFKKKKRETVATIQLFGSSSDVNLL